MISNVLRALFKGVDGMFGEKAKGIKTETTVALYAMHDSIVEFICTAGWVCLSAGVTGFTKEALLWLVVVFFGARMNRTNEAAGSPPGDL